MTIALIVLTTLYLVATAVQIVCLFRLMQDRDYHKEMSDANLAESNVWREELNTSRYRIDERLARADEVLRKK
jgi:hypothetical protein